METAGDAAAGIPGPGEQTCQAVANLASLTYLEEKNTVRKCHDANYCYRFY